MRGQLFEWAVNAFKLELDAEKTLRRKQAVREFRVFRLTEEEFKEYARQTAELLK